MSWIKEHSNIVFVIIFILLLAVVPLVAMQSNTGPKDSGQINSSESITEDKSSQTELNMNTYYSEDDFEGIDFTILVPQGWTKAKKGDEIYFVHSPSGTAVNISSYIYNPSLLNITEEQRAKELQTENKSLLSFVWRDNSSYAASYQGVSGSVTTDYYEYVVFDRSLTIKIVCTVQDQYYDKMSDILSCILDSLTWEKPNPIPDQYSLFYSELGNFEYLVPNTWTIGQNENAIYMQNESGNSSISIAAVSSSASYAGVTQEQYAEYAGSGKEGFSVVSYQVQDNIIYAESQYTISGDSVYMIQYLIASGTYEYTLTFVSYATAFDDNAETWKTVSDCFSLLASS